MGIIIGGSGSTGSSLLAQLLNRHSAIFCGPETALFTKPDLYKNWAAARNKIPGKGLKGDGWHRYNGIDLPERAFGIPSSDIRIMARYSKDLMSFANSFFDKVLKLHNKRTWAEKTPSNAISFHRLVNYPDILLVHCVRDPYDTIASLINRGFNAFYATALYLVNTAAALSARKTEFYVEIAYEKLVEDPEGQLKKILDKLNLEFEEHMLTPSGEEEGIDAWAYTETGAIGTKSVGRFDRLPKYEKNKIIALTEQLVINPAFADKYNIGLQGVPQICRMLDYTIRAADDSFKYNFKRPYYREYWERRLKAYPNTGKLFPVMIKE